MRIDSLLMMAFVGLVLSERAARALENASRMVRNAGGRTGNGGAAGKRSGASGGNMRGRPYLEKLAKDYEIIPLMSKLI